MPLGKKEFNLELSFYNLFFNIREIQIKNLKTSVIYILQYSTSYNTVFYNLV